MRLRVRLMSDMDVERFGSLARALDVNPAYQREGSIWSTETKARLIDSMINGFDVPKFYLEKLHDQPRGPEGFRTRFAIIDGKQRTEAITEFLDNKLSLGDDFIYFEDPKVEAAGLSIQDLRLKYPELVGKFHGFELSLVEVDSTSGDLIEEMFLRLNASTALNAAEKRNAISGPVRDASVDLAEHRFFQSRSPIRNARYKYRELASKFLLIEHQLSTKHEIENTKADTLRKFFEASQGIKPKITDKDVDDYASCVNTVLDRMSSVFHENDTLLSSIGTVVVYYVLFSTNARLESDHSSLRDTLQRFEEERRKIEKDEDGQPLVDSVRDSTFIEYNRYVQSTNDGTAINGRVRILESYLQGAL